MTRTQLLDVPPATFEELEEVVDDIYGLRACIPTAADALGLDMRYVGIFCRHTPDGKKGEDLWLEFRRRQEAKPEGHYNFINFMKEVLAEAGYPLTIG